MKPPNLSTTFGLGRLVLLALFLGFCYQEYYVNRIRTFSEAKTSLDEISTKLVGRLKLRNIVNEFEANQLPDCKEMEAELARHIPSEISDGELDKLIAQAANRSEITILSVNTDESEAAFNHPETLTGNLAARNQEFRRVPISVKAQGRSQNIAHFLSLLLAGEHLFSLDRAGIERSEADFPNVTGSLNLFAYFRETEKEAR